LFIDEIEKLKVYKDRIIAQYIKQNIYPSDDMVRSRLSDIDLALAVFSHDHIKKGESFDVDAYNAAVKAICTDLSILYKNLYDITVRRFTDLQAFAYSHAAELRSDVAKYEKMVEIELSSSVLGNTLLCATGNFKIEHFNTVNIVELGDLKVREGTKVCCLADINDVDNDKVYFELRENPIDYSSIATTVGFYKRSGVYNYNHDCISIPHSGDHLDSLYDKCIIESETGTGKVIVPVIGPDPSREYEIFSGEGMVNIFSYDQLGSSNIMTQKAGLQNTEIKVNSTVEFYVVGGDAITFEFSKQPASCNFAMDANHQVNGLDSVHYFRIEPAADSIMNFTINSGEIYAVVSSGDVVGESLYATMQYGLTDFRVLEKIPGTERTLKAYLIAVTNLEDMEESIESITIKQISE
jgi:hypothetical protein